MKIKTNKVWMNTIKKYGGLMPFYCLPKTREDIVELVQRAENEGKRIKAVGSGHSFSDVAVPETYLVDLKKMNKLLDLPKSIKAGRTDNLVHVEGGMTVQKFNKQMGKPDRNLCVVNMGGIDEQTLAGAISTGTHGTGIDLPSFPGMVRSILMVTHEGKSVRIEPKDGVTDPAKHNEQGVELIQDEDTFNSALVSLGCFGIIYSFILEMKPMYYLEESKTRYEWSFVKYKLQDRSLFYELDGKTPIRGVMVQVNPYKNKEGDRTCIVVRHRMLPGKPKKRGLGARTRNWLSSTLGSLPFSYWVLRRIARRSPHKLPGLLDTSLKSLQDKRYQNKGYKVLYQGAEYIKVRAYDCEFAFNMENKNNDFIEALEAMFDRAEENMKKGRYQTAPMGLRFVDSSPAYLSPEYNHKVAYIDSPFITGSLHLDELLFEYQEIMLKHNGIPHWGKINTVLDEKLDEISQHYPKLKDWQKVLKKFNPTGTFSNKFSERLGLDPS